MTLLLNISITGTVVALVIMLIRALIQKRVSSKLVYGLWGILLIRLLVPFQLTSEMSIFNYIDVPNMTQLEAEPSVQISESSLLDNLKDSNPNNTLDGLMNNEDFTDSDAWIHNNEPVNSDMQPVTFPVDMTEPSLDFDANPQDVVDTDVVSSTGESKAASIMTNTETDRFDSMRLFGRIWAAVAIMLGLFIVICHHRLSRKINEAYLYTDNHELVEMAHKRVGLKRRIRVFASAYIDTPLVYGLIKPRIILSNNFINSCSNAELAYVITHELVHIKRLDYVIKPASLVILILHWFNPVLWVSFMLMQKDMEMSCDEKVLMAFGEDIRHDYANSLVNLARKQNHMINPATLAFGENNIKSRVKGIMTSKSRAKWITGLAVILLIPLAIILLTGKSDKAINEDGDDQSAAEPAISDGAEAENDGDNLVADVSMPPDDGDAFSEALEVLIASYKDGNSTASIQQVLEPEAYDAIVSMGNNGIASLQINLLERRETLDEEDLQSEAFGKEKAAIEWLISEIIMRNADNSAMIRQEHSYSITLPKVCYGRVAPDTSSEPYVTLEQDTVIRIVGFYDMDWMLATLVPPYAENITDYRQAWAQTDQAMFWIQSEDVEYTTTMYTDIWENDGSVALSYMEDFKYIVEDTASPNLVLRTNPDGNSAMIGLAESGDLIALKKDEINQPIRRSGWVLVGQLDQGVENAAIGWVEEQYIRPLLDEDQPNQGFLLRDTEAFETLDGNSSATFDTFYDNLFVAASLQPVKILAHQNGMIQFEDYGMTVRGWVREADVFYQMTQVIEAAIYGGWYDMASFMNHLQSEILSNPNLTLKALDVGLEMALTDGVRTTLAENLTNISNYTIFDGGISPDEEAGYPYYVLDFVDYRIVITHDNRLLLDIDYEDLYAFNIGTEGAPIRWVTPNIEFIQTIEYLCAIQSMVPVGVETDIEQKNYLFNAQEINVYDAEDVLTVGLNEATQISGCVREILDALGDEVAIENPDEGITDGYRFEFVFDGAYFEDVSDADTHRIEIVYTDRYIYYLGRYYEPKIPLYEMLGNLFAG